MILCNGIVSHHTIFSLSYNVIIYKSEINAISDVKSVKGISRRQKWSLTRVSKLLGWTRIKSIDLWFIQILHF